MKVSMKLKRKHPNNFMNFGRHVITYQAQEVMLNEAEIKDLKNDGPKHWFETIVGSDEDADNYEHSLDESKVTKKKATKKKTSKKVSKKVK